MEAKERKPMLSIEQNDGWKATFGDFAEEEAICLADSIDKLYGQLKMERLELMAWSKPIEFVTTHLIHKGFVLAEHKDGAGKVVQRYVYKKRDKEQ